MAQTKLTSGLRSPNFIHEHDESGLVSTPPRWFVAVMVACVVAFSSSVLIHFTFGSIPAAVRYFRGQPIQASSEQISLGDCSAGESRDVVVRLTNRGGAPVRIVGAFAGCDCFVLRGLPTTIAGHGSIEHPVVVDVGSRRGPFHRIINYYTDDKRIPIVKVNVSGRVR